MQMKLRARLPWCWNYFGYQFIIVLRCNEFICSHSMNEILMEICLNLKFESQANQEIESSSTWRRLFRSESDELLRSSSLLLLKYEMIRWSRSMQNFTSDVNRCQFNAIQISFNPSTFIDFISDDDKRRIFVEHFACSVCCDFMIIRVEGLNLIPSNNIRE